MPTKLSSTNRYTDLDLFFVPNPLTSDVPKMVDVGSVIRACRHLVVLSAGEKPFHPEIGAGIRTYLFEPLSILTAHQLEDAIADVIKTYEPRAEVQQIEITPDVSSNGYDVSIELHVLDVHVPVTLEIALTRLR
jgi:phage baseplate assembly protein W